jgi:hypothetical protein
MKSQRLKKLKIKKQDISWENPHEGKTQPPKASKLHVLFSNETHYNTSSETP